MKHSGEPDGSIALPFVQTPRRPSVAVALLIGGGIIALPLLYLIYVGFVTAPVVMGIAAGTVVLLLLFAFLGSRLYYST